MLKSGSRSFARAEHCSLSFNNSCELSLESLANTDERDSIILREARFRNGDLITFFLEGDTKSPTPAPLIGASFSISSSSSFSSSGGGRKATGTAGGGPGGGTGGTRDSFSAIRASLSLISSCKADFARHSFIKLRRHFHELGLQITAHVTIVLNTAHDRAPLLGLVGQLHRQRNLLFRKSRLKRRTCIFDSPLGS